MEIEKSDKEIKRDIDTELQKIMKLYQRFCTRLEQQTLSNVTENDMDEIIDHLTKLKSNHPLFSRPSGENQIFINSQKDREAFIYQYAVERAGVHLQDLTSENAGVRRRAKMTSLCYFLFLYARILSPFTNEPNLSVESAPFETLHRDVWNLLLATAREIRPHMIMVLRLTSKAMRAKSGDVFEVRKKLDLVVDKMAANFLINFLIVGEAIVFGFVGIPDENGETRIKEKLPAVSLSQKMFLVWGEYETQTGISVYLVNTQSSKESDTIREFTEFEKIVGVYTVRHQPNYDRDHPISPDLTDVLLKGSKSIRIAWLPIERALGFISALLNYQVQERPVDMELGMTIVEGFVLPNPVPSMDEMIRVATLVRKNVGRKHYGTYLFRDAQFDGYQGGGNGFLLYSMTTKKFNQSILSYMNDYYTGKVEKSFWYLSNPTGFRELVLDVNNDKDQIEHYKFGFLRRIRDWGVFSAPELNEIYIICRLDMSIEDCIRGAIQVKRRRTGRE